MRKLRRESRSASNEIQKIQWIIVLAILMVFMGVSLAASPDKDIRKADELYALNKYNEAIPAYLKALKKAPTHPHILYRLAICHYETGAFRGGSSPCPKS
ncbi:MAG: tetratricopeptide repeat protein [Marinilabiliales bacterium]|nr:tetratricopeptide repeat protein [Marinilabiliales bacterium]